MDVARSEQQRCFSYRRRSPTKLTDIALSVGNRQDEIEEAILTEKRLEWTRTAFGKMVRISDDFVPPVSKAHCPSRVRKTRARIKKIPAPALPTKKTMVDLPVDFVYDINVRRKLREAIDLERRMLLSETKAKEERLRASNHWIFDANKELKRNSRTTPTGCNLASASVASIESFASTRSRSKHSQSCSQLSTREKIKEKNERDFYSRLVEHEILQFEQRVLEARRERKFDEC